MFQAALFFLYVCHFSSWTIIEVSFLTAFLLVFVSALLYNIMERMDFSSWGKDGIRQVNKRLQGSMLRGFPIRSWKKKSNWHGYVNIGMEELPQLNESRWKKIKLYASELYVNLYFCFFSS